LTAHSFSPVFDAAVLGGGPAGCAAALALAQRGRKVVLLERERFPRFHIGESLLATANDAFDELGIGDRIRAAGFPEKRGASLSTFDGAAGRPVDFTRAREIRRGQTWQVCRERFDEILLAAAREAGVDVREGTRVDRCELDGEGVTVRCAGGGGGDPARARAVVDATGRWGVLAKQLGLRREEPRLASVAIYAHYSGVPRLPGERAGDVRLVARRDAGWFWLIPIDERLTSVGAVLPRALYLRLAKGDPERMLNELVADTPVVAELMGGARREWPVRVEKDFSYAATRYAGDRWLLAGDAGSFLDPVFSTGVAIALESGIEAARAIDRGLAAGDLSAAAFAAYERRQRRRIALFRRFVLAFYTPWFRDVFFQPQAPSFLFRAVVTVLAGNWRPSLRTRCLIEVFFAIVALQRRFSVVPRLVAREPDAGFPLELASRRPG